MQNQKLNRGYTPSIFTGWSHFVKPKRFLRSILRQSETESEMSSQITETILFRSRSDERHRMFRLVILQAARLVMEYMKTKFQFGICTLCRSFKINRSCGPN